MTTIQVVARRGHVPWSCMAIDRSRKCTRGSQLRQRQSDRRCGHRERFLFGRHRHHTRLLRAWPLEQTRSSMGVDNADVVLGIEVIDFADVRSQRQGAERISITANDLFSKSNYTDYLNFAEVDIAIQADGEATQPLLVDAVKRLVTPDRKASFRRTSHQVGSRTSTSLRTIHATSPRLAGMTVRSALAA